MSSSLLPPPSLELKSDEDDSLITLHQQKIDELQSLHAEIPVLTEALEKEPGNIAIAERLARAKDVSKDVDYLTIGPHLIVEYMNATNDTKRTELRERYYKEALKIEPPSFSRPSTKKRLLAPDTVPLSRSVSRLPSTTTTASTPSRNQQLKRKKPKTCIQSTPTTELKWQDTEGDCASCGMKQCTVYTRSTGDRTCRLCGVAVQDNITFDWQDLSYDEKMAANVDVRNLSAQPQDDLDDGGLDEEGNPRKGAVGAFGINEFNDGEASGGNKYKYECRSYMLERLLSVQCLEHAKITAEDFQVIYATLQKHRIYSVTGWTATDMRQFLKVCRLPK